MIVVVAVRGDAADMIGALVLGATTLALAAGLAAVTAGCGPGPALGPLAGPGVAGAPDRGRGAGGLSTAPWLSAAAVALALGVGAAGLFDASCPGTPDAPGPGPAPIRPLRRAPRAAPRDCA